MQSGAGGRAPGDLTIRWTRRSGTLVADSWEQVEVPLAEDAESYEVEIRDGAVIKRTLAASTTALFTPPPSRPRDWGAPLGPGNTLATIGRGAGWASASCGRSSRTTSGVPKATNRASEAGRGSPGGRS